MLVPFLKTIIENIYRNVIILLLMQIIMFMNINMEREDVSDYIKYIQQKIITAAAVCILKSKPSNIDTKKYCTTLQFKIKNDSQCFRTEQSQFSDKVDEDSPHLEHQDFTDIFNEQPCSQNITQEASQIFKNIRENTQKTELNENGECQLNFRIFQALKNVKNIICTMNGSSPFLNMRAHPTGEQGQILYDTQNTQESGYYSGTQSLSHSVFVGSRYYPSLNKSIIILIDFLLKPPENYQAGSIVNYVSEFIGIALDVLNEHGALLECFDYIIDSNSTIIDNIFSQKSLSKVELQQKELVIFFNLNRSSFIIQQSLTILIPRLKCLLSSITDNHKTLEPDTAIELRDPNYMELSYFTFYLLEGLLKQNKENKVYSSQRISSEPNNLDEIYSSTELADINKLNINKKSLQCLKMRSQDSHKNMKTKEQNCDVYESITKILEHLVLECVNSYPLVSFWAMECINCCRNI